MVADLKARAVASIPPGEGRTACVGISGGVDSSVTAVLLREAGYNVVGVHMRNWDESDERAEAVCPATEDLKYATAVCEQLGIPLRRVDFVEEYWNNVFVPFLDAHKRGVTPNPDVACNREIKFGALKACLAAAGDIDVVATGHYARIGPDPMWRPGVTGAARNRLMLCADPLKDQTYFLCGVRGTAFDDVVFPLGALSKPEVRAIAEYEALATAARKDSYGICFIGKRNFADFLVDYITPTPGKLVSVEDGTVMGDHEGMELYTLGQNARIAGQPHKWFVADKDPVSGDVFVAPHTKHTSLFTEWLAADAKSFNWIAGRLPAALEAGSGAGAAGGSGLPCLYRIRHRQDEMGHATVRIEGGKVRVVFDMPQRAVTPGQLVALYSADGDGECYGGGSIVEMGRTLHEQGLPLPEVHRM